MHDRRKSLLDYRMMPIERAHLLVVACKGTKDPPNTHSRPSWSDEIAHIWHSGHYPSIFQVYSLSQIRTWPGIPGLGRCTQAHFHFDPYFHNSAGELVMIMISLSYLQYFFCWPHQRYPNLCVYWVFPAGDSCCKNGNCIIMLMSFASTMSLLVTTERRTLADNLHTLKCSLLEIDSCKKYGIDKLVCLWEPSREKAHY